MEKTKSSATAARASGLNTDREIPEDLMATERKARTQLDRNDWIEGAIDVLAENGVAGLRVEVLAKNFGVTKGSFYWHFKDRQDLLDAVLELWKEGRLRDIEKQTTAVPGKELAQIHHVIDVYSAVRNRKGMSIELAVRDWARHDAKVNAVVEEVDAYRLACTKKLFLTLGLSDDEAHARSILVFAYVFGHSLMAYDRNNPKVAEFKRWIAERITGR
jgi:AcrR family transcriptional regulator